MKKMIVPVVFILILASTPSTLTANGPDLTVTNLAVVTDLNTQTTTVTATVKNIGNASTVTVNSPTGRFDIQLNVSSAGIGQGSQSASNTIRRGPLASGAVTIVSQVFMGTNWQNAHAIADFNCEIPETNEFNNSKGTCNWAYIRDFDEVFAIPVDVGNIALYPADVELVIQEISPGLTVTFSPSVVFLGFDEVITVMMNVEFAPGFTEGYVVVAGIYNDGYTESPARIEPEGQSPLFKEGSQNRDSITESISGRAAVQTAGFNRRSAARIFRRALISLTRIHDFSFFSSFFLFF